MKLALGFGGLTRSGWDVFGKGADEENYVPLGLALLTAICKQVGHDVSALDMRHMKGWDDFVLRATATGAKVFGFSAMSVDYGTARTGAKLLKESIPGATFIIGGVHASICTDWVEKDDVWDHIIVGEGEETLPALLEGIEKGRDTRGSSRIVRQSRPVPLDDLPIPDRDAWNYQMGECNHPWGRLFPAPFIGIIGGRGCPYGCKFCAPANNKMWGGRPRYRSHDSIFRELHHIKKKYVFKSVMFYDDLLIAKAAEGIAFAERYKKEGFTEAIICQARADITAKHHEVIEAMAAVGLKMAIVGFESNNQRVLDFINKGTTTQQNIDTVEICRKNKVLVMANLMFGFPTETDAEMKDTYDFAMWADASIPSPVFFSPTPGTHLWNYCEERGLIISHDVRDFRRDFRGKLRGVNYEYGQQLIQKIMAKGLPRLRGVQ